MSVGARLRRARLDRGLTLDRISDTTKIQLWILHSIERDDLSRVPGGVFVRGYLASFARAVGLDPTEILAEHFGPPQQPAVTQAPDIRRPVYTGTPLWQFAALIVLIAATVVVWRNAMRADSDARERAGRASVASGAGETGQAGGDVVAPPPPPTPTPRAAPASAVEPVAPPVVPAATSGTIRPTPIATSAIAASESIEPAKLAIDLRATSQVWIDATADGERKAYRLFNAGEELHVDAQQQVHLIIGDASAVSYTVNGVAAPPLGAPGVVRDITLTP